jgi:uncharacterized protein (TIGR02246 family)
MTRVVSAIILSSLVFSGLAACTKATPAADAKGEADAILAVEGAMRAAYQVKDPAKVAAVYASDATAYVPGEQRPRVGTDAILKGAQKDLADPAFHLTITTGKVGIFTPGNAGYTKGSFTVRYTDPKTKAATGYSGYYLTLYAKQADGSWKVTEDMATPAG